jgi:hypothetical protein
MLAAGAVSLGVACVVLLAGAGSALACVTDTDGDCFRPNYHVQRTDGSLAQWSGPGTGRIVGWLGGNGTPVEVVCETTGPTEDRLPYVVWDQLDDGTYVYGYYLDTPGDGYHPALAACPGSPPAPTSVTAVPISSTIIHVTWRDNSSGTASYVVSDGTASSSDLARGSTSYDWRVTPGSRTCFRVAATGRGGQSPWSIYACATTPSVPWCPTGDSTHPTCNQTGAFQAPRGSRNGQYVIGFNDYKTAIPQRGPDDARAIEAAGAWAYLRTKGADAAEFFWHYLGNTGSDWHFDARIAYSTSQGFYREVNSTVQHWVTRVHGSADTFDSGYLAFAPRAGEPSQVGENEWKSEDWKYAIGHCFYRVVGTRRVDGSWLVHLQLTSYYQFTPGTIPIGPWKIGPSNVGPIKVGPIMVGPMITVPPITVGSIKVGTDMHRLEQIGWARNFREIGNGTLLYDAAGNPK